MKQQFGNGELQGNKCGWNEQNWQIPFLGVHLIRLMSFVLLLSCQAVFPLDAVNKVASVPISQPHRLHFIVAHGWKPQWIPCYNAKYTLTFPVKPPKALLLYVLVAYAEIHFSFAFPVFESMRERPTSDVKCNFIWDPKINSGTFRGVGLQVTDRSMLTQSRCSS